MGCLFNNVEVNEDTYNSYIKLVNKAKIQQRVKVRGGTYYENHHVLPRSCGGDNSKENLVLLLPREHFEAHQLLAKMYKEGTKEHFKMLNTLAWFIGKGKDKQNITIEEFEQARELLSKRKFSDEMHKKLSEAQKRANTPEVRKKKSISHMGISKGKKASDETRKKMSEKRKGVKYSEERRLKQIEILNRQDVRTKINFALSGDKCYKARSVEKCSYDNHNHVIDTYTVIKDAAEKNNVCYASISKCCRGITKSAGGYFWRYTTSI